MKLIYKNKQLNKTLLKLIENYSELYIAVAWAGGENEVFASLRNNKHKIKKMIIGLHFHQTHPSFIQEFLDHENTFFVKEHEGVYHPKIYLFQNSQNDWSCIIGSANLSCSALTNNNECCVLMTSNDEDGNEFYDDINKCFDAYSKKDFLKKEEFDRYRNVWKSKQSKLSQLAGKYPSNKQKAKLPIETNILSWTWEEFYNAVKNDRHHSFDMRVKTMYTINNYFYQYDHFEDMDLQKRKEAAGFAPDSDIISKYFGSMQGSGNFKHKINDNYEGISKALDCIPLNKVINKKHYRDYKKKFSEVFPDAINPLASFTRLITFKRPDYFVCVDAKNKRKLCKEFGLSKSGLKIDTYWDWVIERIVDSVWWNSEEPDDETERIVWNSRAAFLDAILYEPK